MTTPEPLSVIREALEEIRFHPEHRTDRECVEYAEAQAKIALAALSELERRMDLLEMAVERWRVRLAAGDERGAEQAGLKFMADELEAALSQRTDVVRDEETKA